MTFLHRGKGRRGVAALLTAGSLMAFQALSIVGAVSASASGTCTYNPATDTLNVTVDATTLSTLGVDSVTHSIELDGVACGSATNSNTVAIVVLGQPSSAETLVLDNTDEEFNTAIAWAIDLGTNVLPLVDVFQIDLNDDTDNALILTDISFDLNGGGGELNGVEEIDVNGGDGDDTIDGSAMVAVMLVADGGAGDDWIAPGKFAGDLITGGADSDTVSYGTRTTCIVIDNTLVIGSGADANCDGDSLDVGDEGDSLVDALEVLESGSGNDTLIGGAGDETFIPGDGDDDITGGGGTDTLDYSSSSAAMTIDPAAGTAVGQGSDTFASIEAFVGSDFDDVLIWDGSTTQFSGGAGVDTVDASAETSGQEINLGAAALDCSGITPFTPGDDVENVIGGSGSDTICGNVLGNVLTGGDGNDTILGFGGNDKIEGGLGNDNMDGGAGADTLSFVNAPSGEDIDNQLGFATGGDGEDSIAFFEIILGSDFADTIVAGQNAFSLNQRVKGRGGNDNITGSSSSDTLRGGGGKDVIRAGPGDDNLAGGAGNDLLVGGKGFDFGRGGKGKDICRGVEVTRSCR